MKTRIFISSKTNINYVKHDSSIEVLNDKISFYSYENYIDYVEMKDFDFYIRCKNDPTAMPSFESPTYDEILFKINNAIEENVTDIAFIINENELDLIKTIKDAIDEKIDINVRLIKTKLLLYPLDYAIVKANEKFKEDGNFESLEETIKDIEDKFKLYFFSPVKDVVPTISKIEYDDELLEIRNGSLYDCNKDGIMLIKKYKNRYPFAYLISALQKELTYIDVVPFILYTDSYSKYVEKIEKTILAIKSDAEIVKEVLPAYYGNLYGINSVVVGFIMK